MLGLSITPITLQCEHLPGQSTPVMGQFTWDFVESADLLPFLFKESSGWSNISLGVGVIGKDILKTLEKQYSIGKEPLKSFGLLCTLFLQTYTLGPHCSLPLSYMLCFLVCD